MTTEQTSSSASLKAMLETVISNPFYFTNYAFAGIAELALKEIERLEEYEWMYKDLSE